MRHSHRSFTMSKAVLVLLACGVLGVSSSFAKAKTETPVATEALQQQHAVSGTVVDENGEPVIGANVSIKGTTKGSITDLDGKFRLEGVSPNQTLHVSYVGYATQDLPVGTKTVFNIRLSSSDVQLQEVVVAALGMKKEKKSLAYAVSEVKGDELTMGGTSNLMKSLDGKVSGVNFVQASADPTSSVYVTIRGATSLNLGESTKKSQPLYVVDGIPLGTTGIDERNGVDFGNLLSQMNPEDIESISILKGASAGALYGSQAGNGVIMITTKSGKGGRKGLGVNFNTSVVWDEGYMYPKRQNEFGNGIRDMQSMISADPSFGWGGRLDGTMTLPGRWNMLTQEWESNLPMRAYTTNPMKDFMQTGRTENYNVSVNGNYDKGSFRFSLARMFNKGVIPSNETGRYTANFAADYKLTKDVTVSVNVNYVSQYSPNKAPQNSDALEYAYRLPATIQSPSQMKEVWIRGYEGLKQNAIWYSNSEGFSSISTPKYDNPYFIATQDINSFSKDNFFGKAQLEWKIIEPLKFMARTGLDYNGDLYEHKKAFDFSNDADGLFHSVQSSSLGVNSDLMAIWNKDFGRFSTAATVGYNYSFSRSNTLEGYADGLIRVNDYSLRNGKPGTVRTSNTWGTGQSQSGYITAQVGFDRMLYLDLSGRYDWNGILPEDRASHFYPSASLSWLASETFEMPKWVSLVKARAGVAQVGHGIGRPRNTNTFGFDEYDWGSVKMVSVGGQLVDKNIKAEVTTSIEAGIDLGFFDRRLNGDFTWFRKLHDNQQGNIPVVLATGYNGMLTNIGSVEAYGIEFGINGTPIRNKDWEWNIGVNYTWNRSKIVSLSERFVPDGFKFEGYGPNMAIRLAEGEVVGTLWEEKQIIRKKGGKYDGMPVFNDTGDYQYSNDVRDRQRIGNYNPDFILGLNTSLRFKNFTFTAVGSLRWGGQYMPNSERYLITNGLSTMTLTGNEYATGGRNADYGGQPWPADNASQYAQMNVFINAYNHDVVNGVEVPAVQDATYMHGIWLKPGGDPNNDNDYVLNGADLNNSFLVPPGYILGNAYWNVPASLMQDATNFKLKEISIGYTLPNSWTRKFYVQNLNLSLIGRNVFQWNRNGRNEDPESAFEGVGRNQGVLRKALPPIGSYGFKISLDF